VAQNKEKMAIISKEINLEGESVFSSFGF
jgi:hypothetical protein